MADGDDLPLFDETDRKVFRIKEPRQRADALRDLLVPKINALHRLALERLREVYLIDPNEGSSDKPSVSPDHRRNASTTKEVFAACVGLVGKQVGGKYISPKLIYVLAEDGLRSLLWVNKSREASVFDEVVSRHREPIGTLLGMMDRAARWVGGDGLSIVDSELLRSLPRARIESLEHHWHFGICGRLHRYPIDVGGISEGLMTDFVALFPIYKSMVDLLHAEEDRFDVLFGRFETWNSGRQPRIASPEGGLKSAYRQHRMREKGLRDAKIRAVLSARSGRLRCEVPGCGFDFLDVYGEIGREYAHVHHLDPLGERDVPSETSLDRLAVVCANCHAMIHRGGGSRRLEGLIEQPRRHGEGS